MVVLAMVGTVYGPLTPLAIVRACGPTPSGSQTKELLCLLSVFMVFLGRMAWISQFSRRMGSEIRIYFAYCDDAGTFLQVV
jgi:hypothetical protein